MRVKNYTFIFILTLLILNPNDFAVSQGNEFIEYENKFITTGKATAIGQGQFNLNGDLTINSKELNESLIFYRLKYSASISTFIEAGDITITENVFDKTLNPPIGTGSILQEIWSIFSEDGNRNLSSMFHLTENEIYQGNAKILNYIARISDGASFYSPEIGYRISAYKLDIKNEFIADLTIYFDTNNLVLIGFTMLYVTEINEVLFTLDFTMSIVSSTLILPSAGEILLTKIINGLVVILLMVIPTIWVYKKRKRVYKDVIAGLD